MGACGAMIRDVCLGLGCSRRGDRRPLAAHLLVMISAYNKVVIIVCDHRAEASFLNHDGTI